MNEKTNQRKEKHDRKFSVKIPQAVYDDMKAKATDQNQTVSSYILNLITEDTERGEQTA